MSQQYLVLHMSDSAGSDLPAGEDQAMLGAWAQEGSDAGRLHGGGPVAEAEEARSVTVREGHVLITDGPFPEFKEWFLGYDLITADSIEDATQYMSGHPLATAGRILVLPMVKLPWDED